MKKTITIIRLLSLSISLGFSLNLVKAQSNKNLPKISKTSQMGNFHVSFNDQIITTDSLIDHLDQWLGTTKDHSYLFVTSSVDSLGFKHSTYQHYYKGIKVSDELILIHEKDGKVTYVNGELSENINLFITNPLPQKNVEEIVASDMRVPNVTFDEFEQVITKVYDDKGVSLHYVSQINALSLSALQGYMYYIDNTTKQIVKKLEKIHHHSIANKNISIPLKALNSPKPLLVGPVADTPSLSSTFYKGNQQITVDSYNGAFRLKDNARNIYTRNGTGWNGSGSPSTGELTGNITEYTNSTSIYTDNLTKPAVEVHWAMEVAKDYYVNRHSRNSYDGNGSIIRNYYNINFGTANAPNGANAAAIDTQGIVAMIYGNGFYANSNNPTVNIGAFNPFVGIDVAGHEYSHLIVSRTANLAYQRESGALNESFADMFGAAIEFYSGISPNWNIGEGIPNPALGFTFLRSMSNPNAGPSTLGSQQPDTYQGTYWKDASSSCTPISNPQSGNYNDSCGVHTNSGVGNYWFYLLSVGGSGTNDKGVNYNVAGITIQKAEKIAYRTLATYLTSNSAYIDAYTSSKQAAIDLFGVGSNELQQVENAWCAVGLGNCANLLSVSENTMDTTNGIKIYPNPVHNGQFTIESDFKENATFEIYDLSGKLIKKMSYLRKGNNNVNVQDIQKGGYMIKIKVDGNSISKKIIVD